MRDQLRKDYNIEQTKEKELQVKLADINKQISNQINNIDDM